MAGGWRNCIVKSPIICTFHQIVNYCDDQVKEDEMGGAYSARGGGD